MMRPRQSRDNGQDLVEYALILPIMLLMIIFTVDLGRVWFFYSTLTNVSREGARYGVVNLCDDEGIRTAAKGKALGFHPDDIIIYPIIWNPNDCVPRAFGSTILTVTAQSVFEPITTKYLLPEEEYTIAITTTMYVESFMP